MPRCTHPRRSSRWWRCSSRARIVDKLDPILDTCVAVYTTSLGEDQQVDFKAKAKAKAKAFCRTYLKTFNDHFGTLFTDADRVVKRIRDDIAPKSSSRTSRSGVSPATWCTP